MPSFAVAQTLFGDRVAAIRLAMVLCVSVLAFAVFRITRALTGDEAAGLRRGRCADSVFAEQ